LYLGTSVQPPTKTPNFENIVLCLIHVILRGGLTPERNLLNYLLWNHF